MAVGAFGSAVHMTGYGLLLRGRIREISDARFRQSWFLGTAGTTVNKLGSLGRIGGSVLTVTGLGLGALEVASPV